MAIYTVVQQHFGDRQYWPGQEREVNDFNAPELLKLGLIAQKSAEAAPKNKALGAAPKNKAAHADD